MKNLIKIIFVLLLATFIISCSVDEQFADVINGNPQIINYQITITTGLGESVPATITVVR